jgi:hypothetical protein
MHEHENIQFGEIAQILQQAHLRRSTDLGLWSRQYFRESRQINARKSILHAFDRIVSAIRRGYEGVQLRRRLDLSSVCQVLTRLKAARFTNTSL